MCKFLLFCASATRRSLHGKVRSLEFIQLAVFLFVCFAVVILESGKIEHDFKISMVEVSLMDYGQSEGTQTWKKLSFWSGGPELG